jgi:LysM repeat protein
MANSYSSALVVDTAAAASITVLQPKLSSLKAFNTDFSSDVVSGAGLRKLQVAVVGNAATAQTNPTSFISTGDTVTAAGVTMNHISAQFGLTSAQLNQGFKLEKVLKANLAALGNAIMDVALTPLTTSNYGTAVYNTAITTATGGVLGNDLITKGLPALFAAIANGTERNLILDGSYFSYLQPQSGFSIPVTGGPAYGFDNVYLNTRFNGVTGGSDALLNGTTKTIHGFAASPEALAMASALPYVDGAVANLMLQQEIVEIPGLDGLQIQLSIYGDLSTRGLYGSFDVLFGATKADGSALKFITA